MKITAYEEYGLRILLRIAKILKTNPCSLVSLQDIAITEGISIENSAAILAKLKDAGLVESVRGKYGGYKLSKTPCQINLHQIIQGLAKDTFTDDFCEQHKGTQNHCANSTDCAIRPVWNGLNSLITNFLSSITLEQLMQDETCMTNKIANNLELLNYGS